MAAKKMDILRIQRKIQSICAEIGEFVYEEYSMERPIITETPFLKERMASISEMKLDIGRIEAEVELLRRRQSPTREEPHGSGEEAK